VYSRRVDAGHLISSAADFAPTSHLRPRNKQKTMSTSLNDLPSRYDRITIPNVWLAFVLSLLFHSFLLWGWLPKIPHLPFEDPKHGKQSGSLDVRLAPPPGRPRVQSANPPPVAQAQPTPARKAAPKPAARPPSAPAVIALQTPSPSTSTPPPAEAPRPPSEAARPVASDDFAASLEARRRARGAPPAPPPSQANASPPGETEQERHNRTVAASLGLNKPPTFGADMRPGGGVFQITHMNYNDAEFLFFGWNKDINRRARQTVEVQRGDNATMEIAVVRKMIEIIRRTERGDFQWASPRLLKEVTLSARMSDNAELEDFLTREFFSEYRRR